MRRKLNGAICANGGEASRHAGGLRWSDRQEGFGMEPRASSGSVSRDVAPIRDVVAIMHEGANQTGEGPFTAAALESALRDHGLDGEVVALTGNSDVADAAERAALDGARVVLAVGGDGTIHRAAKGLWRASRAGAHAALGILPAGTMNNVAAALGIPEDADAALDSVAGSLRLGRFRPLDLGRIGDMIFVEEAGFGILTDLTGIGESVKQNDLAVPAAALQIGRMIATYKPAPLTLTLDGRRRRFNALHVLICNAPVIALRMNVAPDARMDDGLLDVIVYDRFRLWQLLTYLARHIGGREIPDTRVRRFHVRSVVMEPYNAPSHANWAVDVDGDKVGDCGPYGRWRRIEAHALPHALSLAALPASPKIEEQPWKTAQRAIASTLKPTPSTPDQPEVSSNPVAAREAAIETAVGQITEPPRRAARRTTLIRTLYVVCAALAVAMGFAARRANILPGDLEITRALQRTRSPRRDTFWRAVAWAGFPRPTALIVAVTTLGLWFARFRLESRFMLLASGVNALNYALKRIVRRQRPAESRVRVLRLIKEPSFPSGHVMFYVSAFGFLMAAALANLRPSALRHAIVAAGASMIALVGASRVYLGAHWPSDVAAGYLFGGLYLGGTLQFYAWAKQRQASGVKRAPSPNANELSTTPDIAPRGGSAC